MDQDPVAIVLTAALDVLNEALQLDPQAVSKLVSTKVPCNTALGEHPNVVVGDKGLGPLGLLNGVLERAVGKKVCAEYEDTDTDCLQVLRFVEYQ